MEENDICIARCGEVFITSQKLFAFHCSLCDKKYEHFPTLLDHISKVHYTDVKWIPDNNGTRHVIQNILNEKIKCDVDSEDSCGLAAFEVIEVTVGATKQETIDEPEYVEFDSIENKTDEEIVDCPMRLRKQKKDNILEHENEGFYSAEDIPNESDINVTPKELHKKQKDKSNKSANVKSKNKELCATEDIPDSTTNAVPKKLRTRKKMEPNIDEPENANLNYVRIKREEDDGFSIKSHKRKKKDPYVCEVCKKLFPSMSNLRAHQPIHGDVRAFKCDLCDSAFKIKSSLRQHRLRHTGIKNHICSHCSKKFYTKNELEIHERIHTGEKPYMCTECGRGFYATGMLSKHMRRHQNNRPHKCEECQMAFFSLERLRDHQVGHTGERNHACNECGATFGRHNTLVQHMKIHKNARGNKCELCGAAFNFKQSLITHMKVRHNVLSIAGKTIVPHTATTVEGVTMCCHCKTVFANSVLLLEHQQLLHKRK